MPSWLGPYFINGAAMKIERSEPETRWWSIFWGHQSAVHCYGVQEWAMFLQLDDRENLESMKMSPPYILISVLWLLSIHPVLLGDTTSSKAKVGGYYPGFSEGWKNLPSPQIAKLTVASRGLWYTKKEVSMVKTALLDITHTYSVLLYPVTTWTKDKRPQVLLVASLPCIWWLMLSDL